MGVASGRPVRGPPAADSRIRLILLPALQSPPSALRGCSLDDALSPRCFKRWQLNKNCSGRPSFFSLPFLHPTTGEAFAKRQQTPTILAFCPSLAMLEVANDSKPTGAGLQVSSQQSAPAVAHELTLAVMLEFQARGQVAAWGADFGFNWVD
jgi:hypothetical protein